jgi:hypothetical protein
MKWTREGLRKNHFHPERIRFDLFWKIYESNLCPVERDSVISENITSCSTKY